MNLLFYSLHVPSWPNTSIKTKYELIFYNDRWLVKDKHLTCVLSMDREILYRCKISEGKW